ncbi:hypothetical protein SAMN04487939_10826 [Lysobacter sp. yr284]|uniref:hypothetical protein n=1 Tax=Lysobacter sp. yr284 TaxID=1761791 RepID=UPI00089A5F1A|nr:hypothetical protein [Lysobacter sp. yr284]SDY89576.1 hypothetical protein SAMN04487939_10826 [Lysobacter sp. yr284]
MQERTNAAPNRYGWILLIVALLAATVGGWPVAIAGLIVGRWLHPFNLAARIGYALCWLALTLIPVVWIAGSGYWEWSWDRVWPPASYILIVLAWWLLRPKLFRRPSRSWASAVGVSLLGAVLTAPGYMGLTTVAPMPYVLGAIAYGSVRAGALDGVSAIFLQSAVLMIAIMFIAHLAVYAPPRRNAAAAPR